MKLETRVRLSERPIVDTMLAALLVLSHGLYLERVWNPWASIESSALLTLYGFGGSIVAIVAGFAGLAVTLGGSGERSRALRSVYGAELRRNRRALLAMSLVAPFFCMAAFIAQANGQGWAPYLFEFALLWTAIRMLRLLWLIDSLLALDDRDQADPGRLAPQELSGDFVERMRAS